MPFVILSSIRTKLLVFGDLLLDNGMPKTYEQVVKEFPNSLNWLEYIQLKKAIPEYWWYLANNECDVEEVLLMKDSIASKGKCVGYIYAQIIEANAVENIRSKWIKFTNTLHSNDTMKEYLMYFKNLYRICTPTKARNFQYKQLTFCIYTNVTLFQWKVVNSANCEFCGQLQTLEHLFYDCIYVVRILKEINDMLKKKLCITFKNIFCCTVIDSVQNLANYVILVYKMYVYRCKCMATKPHTSIFWKEVDQVEFIERHKLIDLAKILSITKNGMFCMNTNRRGRFC